MLRHENGNLRDQCEINLHLLQVFIVFIILFTNQITFPNNLVRIYASARRQNDHYVINLHLLQIIEDLCCNKHDNKGLHDQFTIDFHLLQIW